MADPQTVNTGLAIPVRGSNVGVWDLPVNSDFTALDGFIGGVQTIAAASTPITLTVPAGFTAVPSGGPTQAQNAVLRFTGVLTTPVQVTLPMPGYMIIENLTTGAFVLSFRAIGSGEVIGIDQGACQHIYNDGTNVRFVNLQGVGTYLDDAGAAVPAWITACTKPPFLLCDGSTFSAVTFPYLNSKLGGNVLPDFRGKNRYYLNGGTGNLTTAGAGIDGNTRFATGGSNGATLAANQIPTLTSVNPSQNIVVNSSVNVLQNMTVISNNITGGGGGAFNSPSPPANAPLTSSGSNSITVTYTNGSQVTVKSTTQGTVGGITMIRAA